VAKSPADGYTLLIGATGAMVYNVALYSRLTYDPVKDFAPITMFASTPLVFTVNPSVPAHSMKDLIALAKSKPGQLFYSSGAAPFHAAAELFNKQAGVQITYVPYKGNVEAVNAAVAGDVPIVVADMPTALAQIKAGKLRAIAQTGTMRSKFLPDVPTMMESGVDLEAGSWTGLFAPAGTPKPIIDKLYNALVAVMKSESVKERFAGAGFDTNGMGMPPEEFGAKHRADVAKWTKVMKELNIRAD
jgi:tripartite-type tricarboxylate transporter receptor subunit TctC